MTEAKTVYREWISVEENEYNPVESRWYAMWSVAAMTAQGFRGCPLGRAHDKEGAIRDLIRRTEDENQVKLVLTEPGTPTGNMRPGTEEREFE